MTLLCSSVVSHHWPASGTPYEPKVIPPPTTGGSPHVHDDLWTNAIASGLRLAIGAVADKWNVDIDEAEMRAKLFAEGFPETSVDLRTPAEGGTRVHNGTDVWVVTGLAAGKFGIAKRTKVETPGRLYFAFRLHNTKGWSVWMDGIQSDKTECSPTKRCVEPCAIWPRSLSNRKKQASNCSNWHEFRTSPIAEGAPGRGRFV
jgi:hypothetical protein